jgi:C4-type Zn-finger protein
MTESNRDRKLSWENGICPYCKSSNIEGVAISKRIRGYKGIVVGKEYTCKECECTNQFVGEGERKETIGRKMKGLQKL